MRIKLTDIKWSSDWDGHEVGFPDSEVVGLYWQERDDGRYSFYIDFEKDEVLDFWKDELGDEE